MKRFLYIFIVVGVIVVAVLLVLFLRKQNSSQGGDIFGNLPSVGTQSGTPPSATPTPPPTPATRPTQFSGQKFGFVAENPTVAYFVDSQSNATLVQPDGQVVKVTDGASLVLSSSIITNLSRASFSYDGKKILALFGNATSPQASIFDTITKSWQPLSQELVSAAWSPTDYRIVYFANKNGISVLTTLDTSNPKAKPLDLLILRVQDILLSWIAPNQILLKEKGGVFTQASVWSFDLKNKTLSSFVDGKFGLDSLWSGEAGMGLVFETDETRRGGKLTLLDAAGNALNGIQFLTLPPKCAFDVVPINSSSSTSSSEKYLYCAIPRDREKMSVVQLPDAYQKKAIFTVDDFYKVDLGDGGVSQVFADASLSLDCTQLRIVNQTLFFINRFDQKLYAISLK
jgi:hypothetical protein